MHHAISVLWKYEQELCMIIGFENVGLPETSPVVQSTIPPSMAIIRGTVNPIGDRGCTMTYA
jgi:hypothetical protein